MNSEESVNSHQLPVNSEESLQSSDSSPQKSVTSEQLPVTGETNRAGSVSDRSESDVPPKTQGVRMSRSNGAEPLHAAAKKAARSNSRSDVAEYMRIRRNFV